MFDNLIFYMNLVEKRFLEEVMMREGGKSGEELSESHMAVSFLFSSRNLLIYQGRRTRSLCVVLGWHWTPD